MGNITIPPPAITAMLAQINMFYDRGSGLIANKIYLLDNTITTPELLNNFSQFAISGTTSLVNQVSNIATQNLSTLKNNTQQSNSIIPQTIAVR